MSVFVFGNRLSASFPVCELSNCLTAIFGNLILLICVIRTVKSRINVYFSANFFKKGVKFYACSCKLISKTVILNYACKVFIIIVDSGKTEFP